MIFNGLILSRIVLTSLISGWLITFVSGVRIRYIIKYIDAPRIACGRSGNGKIFCNIRSGITGSREARYIRIIFFASIRKLSFDLAADSPYMVAKSVDVRVVTIMPGPLRTHVIKGAVTMNVDELMSDILSVVFVSPSPLKRLPKIRLPIPMR